MTAFGDLSLLGWSQQYLERVGLVANTSFPCLLSLEM